MKAIQDATDELVKGGYVVPGSDVKGRGYWLYPVMVENKMLYINYLVCKGVMAYKGATQLNYVKPDEGVGECENVIWHMQNVMYLPINAMIPPKDLRQMINRLLDTYKALNSYLR